MSEFASISHCGVRMRGGCLRLPHLNFTHRAWPAYSCVLELSPWTARSPFHLVRSILCGRTRRHRRAGRPRTVACPGESLVPVLAFGMTYLLGLKPAAGVHRVDSCLSGISGGGADAAKRPRVARNVLLAGIIIVICMGFVQACARSRRVSCRLQPAFEHAAALPSCRSISNCGFLLKLLGHGHFLQSHRLLYLALSPKGEFRRFPQGQASSLGCCSVGGPFCLSTASNSPLRRKLILFLGVRLGYKTADLLRQRGDTI